MFVVIDNFSWLKLTAVDFSSVCNCTPYEKRKNRQVVGWKVALNDVPLFDFFFVVVCRHHLHCVITVAVMVLVLLV